MENTNDILKFLRDNRDINTTENLKNNITCIKLYLTPISIRVSDADFTAELLNIYEFIDDFTSRLLPRDPVNIYDVITSLIKLERKFLIFIHSIGNLIE